MKLIFPSKTLEEKINTRFMVKRDRRERKRFFSLFFSGSGVCVMRDVFVIHESRFVFFALWRSEGGRKGKVHENFSPKTEAVK
jgi:hypothetical protein